MQRIHALTNKTVTAVGSITRGPNQPLTLDVIKLATSLSPRVSGATVRPAPNKGLPLMPMTKLNLSNHDFSQYGMDDWWTLEDSILDHFITTEEKTQEQREINRFFRGASK
jgi:hypothetical protein